MLSAATKIRCSDPDTGFGVVGDHVAGDRNVLRPHPGVFRSDVEAVDARRHGVAKRGNALRSLNVQPECIFAGRVADPVAGDYDVANLEPPTRLVRRLGAAIPLAFPLTSRTFPSWATQRAMTFARTTMLVKGRFAKKPRT
jgi:hypothetical protein